MIKTKLILDDKLEVYGIYDSGSNIPLINSRLLKNTNIIVNNNIKEKKLKTISGVKKTDGIVYIKIKIFDLQYKMKVFVINSEHFNYDFLIGLDSIKKFRLCQDENLSIKQKKIPGIAGKKIPTLMSGEKDCMINFNEHVVEESFEMTINHLEYREKNEIDELLEKYKSVFAKDKYDVGTVKNYEAHIELIVEKYPSKRPYRCSIEDKREIEEQISKLLEKKLIEESYSPFAAPVTLAYKRDENKRLRLCIDFRELNKLVVPQSQPFSLIKDLIEKTRDCKLFSTLDLNSPFWAIPLKVEDRKKKLALLHRIIISNGHAYHLD